MRFTALIVTRHRSLWFRRCLESLRESPLNVRALINGRDAASRDVGAELSANFPVPQDLRIRELEVAISPPAARNLLWAGISPHERTSDHWILFLDDDAYFEPSALKQMIDALSQGINYELVGGPNLTPPQSPWFAEATGVALASRLSTLLSFRRWRADGPPAEQPNGKKVTVANTSSSAGEESLTLCNLWVRADHLARAGRNPDEAPFLPDYFYGEETRLIERLAQTGTRIGRDPRFWAYHERKATPAQLARQVFRSAKGRARGQRAKLMRRQAVHFLPTFGLGLALSLALVTPEIFWWAAAVYGLAIVAATHRSATRLHASTPARLGALFVPPIIHFSYALGYGVGWLSPGR